MESTNNLPIPFHPNMYSTKTAPDNIEANHPEAVVNTEVKEFLKASKKTDQHFEDENVTKS